MANNLSSCLIAAMDRLCPSLSSAADQQEPAPEEQVKKRSRRGNHSLSHSFSSSSSSPPTQKRDKSINNRCKPRKSTSFRSLKDLELEEVKGFMDLGFTFTKEHLNPTMIRVVPGLLRLGFEQEKKRVVVRPYLSEAWLIKRPDSPLLNLRPRVYAAADMKKHLMFWARIVASVVRQES
ncbi:uncharacterized protein LOC120214550 [Hibiscus syriacus]|nr:uncharacterized protein LOC120214550 [Hibiscus syriacus]